MASISDLPVAIIGGGPIGLAAAANLASRGVPFRVYEAGDTVGANVRDWSHVRIFTTWEQSVDAVSCRLLERHGWRMESPNKLPTGGDLYEGYLKPLAQTPELAPHLETGARVTAIARAGIDKVMSAGRETKPFRLQIVLRDGRVREELAPPDGRPPASWSIAIASPTACLMFSAASARLTPAAESWSLAAGIRRSTSCSIWSSLPRRRLGPGRPGWCAAPT